MPRKSKRIEGTDYLDPKMKERETKINKQKKCSLLFNFLGVVRSNATKINLQILVNNQHANKHQKK